MRMANRRFTRLTNAFSKKFENYVHMVALYTVWYDFIKMQKTLRMTPALAAGVTDKVWSMADLVEMMEAVAVEEANLVSRAGGSICKRATETRWRREAPSNGVDKP